MNLLQIQSSTVFLYCIAAAVVLVYLPFLLVGYARVQVGYDIAAPRTMFDKLPPYAQRASWAHLNSFEAIAIFAPAALMAYVTGVNSSLAIIAAIAFVVVRFLYSVFYIANIPLARSLMFVIGSVCSGILIVLSILQATGSSPLP
jgi:uncharacterized MAPEG superfamily protein